MEDDPYRLTKQLLAELEAIESALPEKLQRGRATRRAWWMTFAQQTLSGVVATVIGGAIVALVGVGIGAIRGISALIIWISVAGVLIALGALILLLLSFPPEVREVMRARSRVGGIAMIEGEVELARTRVRIQQEREAKDQSS